MGGINSVDINNVLNTSWQHYKKTMIAKDGRPLGDPDGGDIDGDGDKAERVTVSEAASYVLLRAAWMKDKKAFDKTWKWAKQNLQRKNLKDVYYWNKKQWVKSPKADFLFAWRYVPSLKGRSGGVIHYDWIGESVWRGCLEGASDADLDIAASLIFANKVWREKAYLTEAKNILNDIWAKYVKKVGEKYYLFGGDQFQSMGEANPSYMRPSYYKMFAAVDPSHPWQKLLPSSYKVIVGSGDLNMYDEKGKSIPGKVNLPPNWIDIQRNGTFTDSDIFRSQGGQLFGWDAFRTLFWVAEDYAWNATPEARKYLTDKSCTPADYGPYCFLNKKLNARGHLNAGYSHDGRAVSPSGWWSNNLNKEQFAMNGVYLPYFYFSGNKKAAAKIYSNLRKTYHREGYWGDNPSDYYGQNWAWFGLALVSGKAANLFKPGTIITPRKEYAPEKETTIPIAPAKTTAPGSSGVFKANLSKISRGTHPSGDIPVVVYYDIRQVPPGTKTLSLYFVTNKEWIQDSASWDRNKKYSFKANIFSGHSPYLGKPGGKNIEIQTILKALSDSGETLGEIKSNFTLDRVK